ncbi:very short patch repair endonuclease [Devosia alba]|uniref:very short patch repair endonuclease n=1 Tax=Devosia alba TaxID=3152360 RepID=UPI003266D28E
MTDRISQERRSWNMSRIRGKNTTPEVQLRKLLHAAGYRFRLHGRNLPGKPDIVLKKYKTAIFVHGCFWHRHEGCAGATVPKTRTEFWTAKFQDTVQRDQRKQQELEKSGWRVITVWECDVRRRPDGVLKDIVSHMVSI